MQKVVATKQAEVGFSPLVRIIRLFWLFDFDLDTEGL